VRRALSRGALRHRAVGRDGQCPQLVDCVLAMISEVVLGNLKQANNVDR
jgi:hypothetical protein